MIEVDVGPLAHAVTHDEVGIVEVQILGAPHRGDLDVDVAVDGIEARQPGHQPLDREAGQDLQPQPTRIDRFDGVADGRLDAVEQIGQSHRELAAGLGQLDLAPGLAQQRDAHRRLEQLDLLADRAGRDVQQLGRAADAAGAVNGVEHAQRSEQVAQFVHRRQFRATKGSPETME